MSTKYRPSALTAVLELMLVLAVGLAVIGVVRGWFVQAGPPRNGPLLDVTDRESGPVEKSSDSDRAEPAPRWPTAGGTPSPFAAASSAEPGNAWTWNARAPVGEERRD